jgi:ATP-dependent Lon protease
MFSSGYGFVVDYLAEVLRSLRNQDYSDRYQEYFSLSTDISTRDRDGINKTFSGLMKIIFPNGGATQKEIEELLRFAIEGRKRVKDQLMRIDSTYGNVSFNYIGTDGRVKPVTTLEEGEYPGYYHKRVDSEEIALDNKKSELESELPPVAQLPPATDHSPKAQHLTFQENQKGISFDMLLGPYLKGATAITVTDPYIRKFYQARNFMEFLETVVRHKAPDEEISVHLVTMEDAYNGDQQKLNFDNKAVCERCRHPVHLGV